MPKKDSDLEFKEIPHVHVWGYRPGDISAEYCTCGAILVSPQELERREEEWLNYRQLVTTTPGYRLCQHFMNKDTKARLTQKEVEELKAQVADRMKVEIDEFGEAIYTQDESKYLPKPRFPDPGVSRLYHTRRSA